MKELGIVFSGQGSQYPGMFKELMSVYPNGKEFFENASELCGLNLIDICSNASEEKLKETRIAQLSTVVYSVALYDFFVKENGILPKLFAGHSVGEYAALIASGMLSFEDGIRLVNKRGSLMQNIAQAGGMLAILDDDILNIEMYCKEQNSEGNEIAISNYNSDHQTIISGTVEQIERAQEYFEKSNISVKLLKVSGAFHSPLMRTTEDAFEKELQKCKFRMNTNIVFSNVDAEAYESEDDIRLKLKMQLSRPVLWNDIMHALRRQQVDIVIECGPQKTLTNMVKTVSGFSAYSYSKDREEIKHIIRERYSVSNNLRNLIERGLTIIACTRNCNDSMENYQIEVIERGKRLRGMIKHCNGIERIDELLIKDIINCLQEMLNAKKISPDEQKKWFHKLENDTADLQLQRILANEIKTRFS